MVETKNKNLIDLIEAGKVTPGLRVNIDVEGEPSAETKAEAQKRKAEPAKLKKIGVVK